jgi:hypothetical protein
LVYQDTLWTEGIYSWSDPKISAPYLSNEAGSFFTLKNFEENLTDIINNKQINPQNYCKNNLSDQKSVQILLDIIKKHENN